MNNILINIPSIRKEEGGTYQYSVALLKILAKANLPYRFFVLCNNPSGDVKKIVEEYGNFKFTRNSSPAYSRSKLIVFRLVNALFRRLGLKYRLKVKDLYDYIILENDIHIIHTPTQSVVKKEGVKSIATLHDVQELHYPEFFTSSQRAKRAVKFKKSIDGADAVVVSYDHVKKDIVKYFDKPESQVHTILLDMQDLWFSRVVPSGEQVLNKSKLPINFLLYPASSWEHKNHLNLIRAVKEANNPEIHLICTGHPTAHYHQEISPLIEELGLTNNVRFLGIVSDEELLELYQKCRAVVVPTLYEAGSFPLMESILIGIPVICSNATSLPETIGNNSFVFDPLNCADMALKITKIWGDEHYRERNLALCSDQGEKLTNNNSAEKMDSVYKEILRS